ncbi:MAG: hypothetical protein JWQ09_5161 [Segetibacter sp.]|nr:hypothetical protein [Segetibacter sp.]
MSNQTLELQKEFELERMILFSDAVFAIGITLLIIEIKFPEVPKGVSDREVFELFKPTIISFLAFMLSFFFVGLLWSRHLEIFKYVRTYDKGVIFHNLLLLFFVVCFPFTASGLTEHIRPSFLLPIYIYFINLAFVLLSQYALCNYIFRQKKYLAKPGYEVEKNYLLLKSKYTALALSAAVCIVLILSFIFPHNSLYSLMGIYAVPIILGIMKRRIKKYKPVANKE